MNQLDKGPARESKECPHPHPWTGRGLVQPIAPTLTSSEEYRVLNTGSTARRGAQDATGDTLAAHAVMGAKKLTVSVHGVVDGAEADDLFSFRDFKNHLLVLHATINVAQSARRGP